MNEDYCSYELSKALKECGFDEPCIAQWACEPDGKPILVGSTAFVFSNAELKGRDVTAPLLFHAQKWLREKWLLHIGANPAIPTLKWQFYIDDLNQQINPYDGELMTRWDDDMQGKADKQLHDSYEAALSAGISAALELIKKGEQDMDATEILKSKGWYGEAKIIMHNPIGYLKHEPTGYSLEVYKPISRFKRLMLRWCFGLKFEKI